MTQTLPIKSALRRSLSAFSVRKVPKYLFCFAVAVAVSLTPLSKANEANASQINETFEGYSLGALNGQGTWAGNAGNVVNTLSHNGSQSAFFNDANGHSSDFTFDSLGSSVIEFWAYPGTGAYQKMIDFYLAPLNAGIRFECYFHNCDVGNGWSVYSMSASGWYGNFEGYVPAGSWQKFQMEFDATTHQMRFYVNGAWNAWEDLAISASSFNTGHFNTTYAEAKGVYFDDIGLPYAPLYGTWPVITPSWPVDCQMNATDTFTGNATGKVEIPTASTSTWTKLEVAFKEQASATTSVASTTFSLGAGEKYDYSIPYALATGTYDVWYFIDGYEQVATGTYVDVGMGYSCPNTAMGYGATPTAPEIVGPPEEYAQEDCSGYNLLERMVCEIKNFLSSIFVASPAKMTQLSQTMEQVKQKAPYTYLLATKQFLIDVNSQLSSSTPTIILSMFGATGTIDFSWAEATTSFAGTTQSVKSMMRGFFAIFLLLTLLLGWELNFLRRIFK